MFKTEKIMPLKGTQNKKHNSEIIIAGRTYNVNELAPFFTRAALRTADKETLYKYWHLAVESGCRQYRTAVDNAFIEQFPNE